MRAGLAGPVAVVLLALSACGGGESAAETENGSETDAGSEGGAAADTSTCVDEASAAPSPDPAAFPASWPFPRGSVVFDVQDRGELGTVLTAVTPEDFEAVLDHMNTEVVGAGFETTEGETEEDDAEADWVGGGFRGRWAIRASSTCAGETVVQVVAAPEDD